MKITRKQIDKLIKEELEQLIQQKTQFDNTCSTITNEIEIATERMERLANSIRHESETLKRLMSEIGREITNVVGENNYTINYEYSEYEIQITVGIKSHDNIKQYLKQHENELSSFFSDYGDFEGQTLDNINKPEDIMSLLENILQEKEEYLDRTYKGYDTYISTYRTQINITIETPFNIEKITDNLSNSSIMDV